MRSRIFRVCATGIFLVSAVGVSCAQGLGGGWGRGASPGGGGVSPLPMPGQGSGMGRGGASRPDWRPDWRPDRAEGFRPRERGAYPHWSGPWQGAGRRGWWGGSGVGLAYPWGYGDEPPDEPVPPLPQEPPPPQEPVVSSGPKTVSPPATTTGAASSAEADRSLDCGKGRRLRIGGGKSGFGCISP